MDVRKNIKEVMLHLGIGDLSRMQTDTIGAIEETDRDVVVLSPTGSGKTLAYLLPLVTQIDGLSDDVQAVIIVPGRELAVQSAEVLKSMHVGIRAYACYGGRMAMEEHRVMKQIRPQIIFGTPGRLNDHLDKNNFSIDKVRFVVIDEFDKCLEMGFLAEMEALMRRFPNTGRRNILLSATDTPSIPKFIRLEHAVRLDYLGKGEPASDRVELYQVGSPQKDKLETLFQLLLDRGSESSIVFLNYRESVERVAAYLRERGFYLSIFHGGLEQKQREDALYQFANGSANIMVCTDLGSRGLDIPDVNNIIHYHLPETEQNYIHRIGRTARWNKQGRVFFILGPGERIPEYVGMSLETYQFSNEDNAHGSDPKVKVPEPPKMVTIYIGKGKKDKLSKGDIVGFLCKKGKLQGSEIGKISVEERFTYAAISRHRLQEVLRNVAGEKIKGIRTVVEVVK